MAQDYKLTSFEKGDFKDNFGNYWCNAAFEGVSEPVRWVVKDPATIKVGETYYGDIKDATSQAGKPYLRFHREKKEESAQSSASPSKKEWQPRDDDAIRAQWAIGQSVAAHVGLSTDGKLQYELIEATAKEFFSMVNRVKKGDETTASDTVHEVPEGEPFSLDDIPY